MAIKKLFSRILSGYSVMIISLTLSAQRFEGNTPLHKFSQDNFDSTIIYYPWSSWYIYPKYYIAAKKEGSVNFFTYVSPYSAVKGRHLPGNLTYKFAYEEGLFKTTTPDTNRYFLPYYVTYYLKNEYWRNINSYNIWNVKYDMDFNNKPFKKCGDIDDGLEETYYLITKAKIKTTHFYEADFFFNCDTTNIHRRNEIKTRDYFRKVFQNSN